LPEKKHTFFKNVSRETFGYVRRLAAGDGIAAFEIYARNSVRLCCCSGGHNQKSFLFRIVGRPLVCGRLQGLSINVPRETIYQQGVVQSLFIIAGGFFCTLFVLCLGVFLLYAVFVRLLVCRLFLVVRAWLSLRIFEKGIFVFGGKPSNFASI